MPAILPNTPTANDYPATNNPAGAQVGLNDIFASGYFVVANAAAYAQYQHGQQGQQDFSTDIFMPPATYPLVGTETDPLGGIRFKSAVTGIPAQVFGVLYKKGESALLAGSEFSSQISSSGQIGGILISGRVDFNGVIASGSGFTVLHPAVGVYDITFDTSFVSIPVTVANVRGVSDTLCTVSNQLTTGVRINVLSAGIAADIGFNFIVTQ